MSRTSDPAKHIRAAGGPGREPYFRGIASLFLALRGAPFSLSPADVYLISAWESAGIPLPVVLEGIENSFALKPGGSRVTGKIRTLSFCRPAVEKAFARHRDRRTGGGRPSGEAEAAVRQAAARAAVKEFLSRRPPVPDALYAFFERAAALWAADRPEADSLDRLEAKIETVLRTSAGAEERRKAELAAARGYPDLRGEAKAAAVGVLLVKGSREKFRIPHVSPFYY